MATQFLGARLTTGPQLQHFLDAVPTPVGPSVGTAVTYGTTCAPFVNNALYWGGYRYWLAGDAIRRRPHDSAATLAYETVLTLSPVAVTANGCVVYGPFVVHAAGVPRLVIVYQATGNAIHYAWSATGAPGTWTTVSTGFTTSNGGIGRPFVHQSTLVVTSRNLTSAITLTVIQINPFTGAVSSTPMTSQIGATASGYYVTWNDSLFVVGAAYSGVANGLRLVSLIGGVGTVVQTIDASSLWDVETIVAFVDPSSDNLIVVGRRGTGGTWRAYEIGPGPTYTVTERTSTMLTGGTLTGFASTAKGFGVFYDQDSAFGGAISIYVVYSTSNTAGSALNFFRYNGTGALLGTGVGAPNSSGGDVILSIAVDNIGSERFYSEPPIPVSPGTSDGPPVANHTGKGSPSSAATRRKLRLYASRGQLLATIGGAPATHDLSTTPLSPTPIQLGTVTLRGTIAGTVQATKDDGAGVFPVSALLPSGGTVDYSTGAMTGVTASLDAATAVVAMFNGGTADYSIYAVSATDEYPSDTDARRALSAPTHGSITGGGLVNSGVPADGTEVQVTAAMGGFAQGDRFNMQAHVL